MMYFETKAVWVMQKLHVDFPILKDFHLAAIVGNGGAESGLVAVNEKSPTVAGSRGGFGWFQWTGLRRKNFEAWCEANGFNERDDVAQYGFLVNELRGDHAYALPKLLATATLASAVVAFELAYEGAGVKNYPGRTAFAQRALAAYHVRPSIIVPVPTPAPQPDDPGPAPIVMPSPQEEAKALEPEPLTQSTTIWSMVSGVIASGGASVLAYIQSPYALIALGMVLVFGYVIYRERVKRYNKDAV